MKGLIVMAMFVASFSHAAWRDYTETRDLELDAADVERVEIDAGAGSLVVTGVNGLEKIVVQATINIPNADDDEAARLIEKKLRLGLEERRSVAKLDAYFDGGFFGGTRGAGIDLDVRLPVGIAISIDDGSGPVVVTNTAADISIDDGSGSVEVRSVADVVIDDGSGSIDVANVEGDVSITDGSGGIDVRGVAGSVTIDDGSGRIRVSDIEQDVVIVDDGSGSVSISNVRGKVEQDS